MVGRDKRMRTMAIKSWVRYAFVIVFLSFILNKTILKPWVFAHDLPSFMVILVNSFPNFAEAILGTLVLAGMAMVLKDRQPKHFGHLKDGTLYLIVSILAGIYVISQELKFHNLGGNNVYDPYDVVASILGLLLVYGLMQKYGIVTGSA